MSNIIKRITVFIILLTTAVNLPAENKIPSGIWDDWSNDQAVLSSGSIYVKASEADRQDF